MSKRTLVLAALATLAVVAYVFWWPSLIQAVQTMHGPLGGGPAMHLR